MARSPDADLANADWAKQTWDLPTTVEGLMWVMGYYGADPVAELARFMDTPAARAMPPELAAALAASPVTKHGDPSRPGYKLLHPGTHRRMEDLTGTLWREGRPGAFNLNLHGHTGSIYRSGDRFHYSAGVGEVEYAEGTAATLAEAKVAVAQAIQNRRFLTADPPGLAEPDLLWSEGATISDEARQTIERAYDRFVDIYPEVGDGWINSVSTRSDLTNALAYTEPIWPQPQVIEGWHSWPTTEPLALVQRKYGRPGVHIGFSHEAFYPLDESKRPAGNNPVTVWHMPTTPAYPAAFHEFAHALWFKHLGIGEVSPDRGGPDHITAAVRAPASSKIPSPSSYGSRNAAEQFAEVVTAVHLFPERYPSMYVERWKRWITDELARLDRGVSKAAEVSGKRLPWAIYDDFGLFDDVVTKHGDPSRPGYSLLHPGGRHLPGPGLGGHPHDALAYWADESRDIASPLRAEIATGVEQPGENGALAHSILEAFADHMRPSPEPLFRGAELEGGRRVGGATNAESFGADFAVGTRFDMPMASFSRERSTVETYFTKGPGDSVVFELEPGAMTYDISDALPPSWKEREELAYGTFVVTDLRRHADLDGTGERIELLIREVIP